MPRGRLGPLGPAAPPLSRLPTPSRGPQSPGRRAGTEQAAPPAPRRPATPGPRRRAGRRRPYPLGGGAGRRAAGSPRGTASPSHWLSASRWAPCPPSCLSPRSSALAARKRAPIAPSPPSGGREADGRATDVAEGKACARTLPLASSGDSAGGASVLPAALALPLAEENPHEVARRPRSF